MVKITLLVLLYFFFHPWQMHLNAQTVVKSVTPLHETVNSKAEEIMPLLTSSGDSLFFSRVFHEENKGGIYSGSDIWFTTRNKDSNEWNATASNVEIINDKRNNFVVGIDISSKTLYLNHPKSPEKGIQFIKNVLGEWTSPETINISGIPNTGYKGLYVSPDYEVILISMKTENSIGAEDLYVVLKDEKGHWREPVNLGSTINTVESEISPFLSEDKKTLYFASAGHGGFGDMDIFSAERLYNSWTVWSKPKNLGSEINSKSFDAYYSQYSDTLAFFSSNREGKLADIYQVKLGIGVSKTGIENIVQENEKKQLLTQKQISDVFGFIPDPHINFEKNADEISPSSTELLYFIANTINTMSDIHILLVANDNGKTVLAGNRLTRASIYLQNNGISPRRIKIEIAPQNEIKSSGDDKISFYLYKLNDN